MTTTETKDLKFSGDWTIKVVSLDSASRKEKRIAITDATTDASLPATVGATLDVVAKADKPWSLRIQTRKDTTSQTWSDLPLRITGDGTQGGKQFREVGAEDGSDDDFDDVVIRLERPLAAAASAEPMRISQGARGIAIQAQLIDGDGQVVSVPKTARVKFILALAEVTPLVMVRGKDDPGVGSVVDADRGMVVYTAQAGDFDRVGRYRAEFWIENGGEVFAFPVANKLAIEVFKVVDRL